MGGKPATVDQVRDIVKHELSNCDDEQLAAFRRYAVEPYIAPIVRYGKTEAVVVIAREGVEAIYWEDVEEGFNVSPVAEDGHILEHWCNQDELGHALNFWIDRRERSNRVGPATPVK